MTLSRVAPPSDQFGGEDPRRFHWAGRSAMQTRETTPLWVWLTFGLLTMGTVLYLTGYFMIEDIRAFFK
jgi:hypothetical protein